MWVSLRVITLLLTFLLLGNGLYADDRLHIITLNDQLEYPWAMAWVNQTRHVLVTLKRGQIALLDQQGKKKAQFNLDLPIAYGGQGGLLDIVLHPNYPKNHWVYFSYSQALSSGYTTAVARAKITVNPPQLTQLETIYSAQAVSDNTHHFGSRLAFDTKHLLYVTVGDRGERSRAQHLTNDFGKVLRLTDEGKPAADNPFSNSSDKRSEIFSYGHRNPQGLVYDIKTNTMWLHEHGPLGGDEVNRLKAGKNYGWPMVTYGREYSGLLISKFTSLPGMISPEWYWVPSIAPSGMTIYYGELFKRWQGQLLVGALKAKLLVRLPLLNNRIQREQRFAMTARIRDVEVGGDGAIYLITDESKGKLLKIIPRQ
ncbi:PQQ-dependent sugar dehydrogenase [Zooshikella ganghwensis]|uniref:PQQ-dependent sugar dehydrogenase n=1 Tax=Zooshikella ganghwensis TaxID=202772 RepID=UPI000413C10C|nr:PQQ-dependent sugar dehydrogenase [Zooshikella ganghwensis]